MTNQLNQVTRPFNASGNYVMPLLRTWFGSSKSQALTTSAGAALQIHNSDFDRPVRIWAIGCPVIYKCGDSSVTGPSATADGFILADSYIETYMAADEQYIRAAAVSGTGTLRVEVLR
jgi:hypothetical protein